MSDIVRPSRTDEPLQEDIKKFNKEYVFIGNAQNKTRDYIKFLEKENKEKDECGNFWQSEYFKCKTKLEFEKNLRLTEEKNMCISIEERQSRIDKVIEYLNSLSSKGRDCEIYYDVKQKILKILKGYK